MVAALRAVDVSVGCMGMVGQVKAAGDRPRSPRRGPARVAPCHDERQSGARGEALWAPVGDPGHGRHAAELSAATRRRRREGPLSSIRCARWTMRSGIASARVGSPITSCQRLTGTWLVISSDPRSQRSSTISRRSRRCSELSGSGPQSPDQVRGPMISRRCVQARSAAAACGLRRAPGSDR